MKKIFLSIFAILAFANLQTNAQYTLSGTSYTQDFDGIGAGLPSGWRVDSLVDKNAGLGNDAIFRFSSSVVSWSSTTRGFKNVASADGLIATSTSTDQSASTDRALGARQVSSSGWDGVDSLISMSFNMTNTAGLSNFNLSFKLQSLHEAGNVKRYSDWIVQYGIGASPTTFTTIATTPVTVTIDSNFSNTTVAVNFGTALDNITQPVWIRITPNSQSSGTGSRPMVGLDDFNLTWTGTAVNNTPQAVSFTPATGTTTVPPTTTTLQIDFDKNITIGTGNVTINNLTDVTSQTIAASTCTATGMNVTIPGVNLLAGKNYAVQYDSTCFMWTTYNGLGIYNNTTWFFSTISGVPPPVTSLNESFVGCNAPLLASFMQFSTTGTQTWRCSNFGRNDTDAVYMNGFASGASNDNEDWLISPPLDFTAMSMPYLHFWSKKRFTGTDTKEVFVSNNFAGDPTTASWTNLNANFANLDTVYSFFSNYSLTAYKSAPMNIAFKYVSTSTGTSDEWSIDDVFVTEGTVGVQNFSENGVNAVVLELPQIN
jgi:hypothetical protein